MLSELGTDLRRASTGAAAGSAAGAAGAAPRTKQAGGLSAALQDAAAADVASPFAAAAENLALFPTQRCVQMTPADWAELSAILHSITRLCHSSQHGQPSPASATNAAADTAALAHMLELLQRLGRVTACLLCVNADDCTFSIARVAQAIRTVTTLLEAVLQQAAPAGLSAEVADRLARQRCEQTPLLSAMAWAMGQEARALFFNPRPTALSLATALMELFRGVQHLWPQGVFVAQHGQQFDAAAARMAEPAAQLALAMLRCAGCALQEVGPGATRQPLLCGLQVAWDLQAQLSALLQQQMQQQAAPACDQVKQLQASPAMPRLMLALLAVETQRLHQQLGVTPDDSGIRLQAKRDREQRQARSKRQSQQDAPGEQQPAAPLQHTPSQQRLQQQRQQQREQEEHEEIEGAGELHQLWHQVLGMAQKGRTREDQQQQEEEEAGVQRAPLQQLWLSLGLPEGLLRLAADADVPSPTAAAAPAAAAPAAATPAPATQDRYVAVCRLVLFLLQGSPLLQPHHHHQHHGEAAQQHTLTVTAVQPGSPAGWGPGSGPFAEGWPAASGSPPPGSPGAAAAWRLAPLASTGSLSPRELLQLQPETATSLTAEAAEQLLEGARDHGLSGAEELELLRLQRVVPVVLLDTAGSLLRPGQAAASAGGSVAALPPPSEQQLCVMHAACAAAACVSRCWPVLCKVTAQQDELAELLTDCQPVAGFGGLSTVCWQRYQTPAEVHLPVLELLQLVVRLLWRLQPPWQQQQQANGQQQLPPHLLGGVWQPRAHGAAGEAPLANNSSHARVIVSPRTGECLDSLLEVLTAVSKLPQCRNAGSSSGLGALASGAPAAAGDDADSSSSSSHGVQSLQEGEARLVAAAWQDMCQPVAAAVEVCVRTAGQVAAAAAGVPKHVVQRHPSAVALGGCLASLCAPWGRPGPLVAAAAAAAPGGPEQQQLFALLASEVKVLLWDPTSKKAALIAMHALEQTPIILIKRLRGAATTAGLAAGPGAAAERPWLLLLCRMMVLRGKLLAHQLTHGDGSSNGGDSREGASSTLHTAFWHVRSAEQSAATLVACLHSSSSSDAAGAGHEARLRLQLLPALKQAVQLLMAALKLSRHANESGYASAFSAGFASGFAAAMAAAGGGSVAADGSPDSSCPWARTGGVCDARGVLQQACITALPAQLEAVGCGLAWQLRAAAAGCCSNPSCVDLSWGSELWLLRDGASSGDGGSAVLCGSCTRLGLPRPPATSVCV